MTDNYSQERRLTQAQWDALGGVYQGDTWYLVEINSTTFRLYVTNTDGSIAKELAIDETHPTIASGSGAPTTTAGKVGDIYIDTATSDIYVATSTGNSPASNDWTGVETETVVGPASATDNAIVRFDTTTGKLIQDSNVTIDDSDNVTGFSSVSLAEKAAAEADVAGYGQFWVKTATPNLPMFTDDAGTDFHLQYKTETVQATTSGTAFDFTGIPASARVIMILFDSVSLSGTESILVQIGDAGGIETTGYSSSAGYSGGDTTSTAGFIMVGGGGANTVSGIMTLSKVTGNVWVSSHSCKFGSNGIFGGGTKTLSDTLTQIRVTRTGSDTFDAGQVNISYM